MEAQAQCFLLFSRIRAEIEKNNKRIAVLQDFHVCKVWLTNGTSRSSWSVKIPCPSSVKFPLVVHFHDLMLLPQRISTQNYDIQIPHTIFDRKSTFSYRFLSASGNMTGTSTMTCERINAREWIISCTNDVHDIFVVSQSLSRAYLHSLQNVNIS